MRWAAIVAIVIVGCRSKADTTVCPEPSTGVPALTVDLPRAQMGGDLQTYFVIVLMVDGTTFVNGEAMANDDAILAAARAARAKTPELRALINADTAVTHGRVIRTIDLVKQAGISQIAFGVKPVVGEPMPGPPRPGMR